MNVPNSIKIAKVGAKFCQSLPKETFKIAKEMNLHHIWSHCLLISEVDCIKLNIS